MRKISKPKSTISICQIQCTPKIIQVDCAYLLGGNIYEAGLTPNVSSFNATVVACEVGGQWQCTLSPLGDMSMADVPPELARYNELHKIRMNHRRRMRLRGRGGQMRGYRSRR